MTRALSPSEVKIRRADPDAEVRRILEEFNQAVRGGVMYGFHFRPKSIAFQMDSELRARVLLRILEEGWSAIVWDFDEGPDDGSASWKIVLVDPELVHKLRHSRRLDQRLLGAFKRLTGFLSVKTRFALTWWLDLVAGPDYSTWYPTKRF